MDKIIIKMKKEVSDKIIEICDRFNNAPGELINVLHQTQDFLGYLPAEAQELIQKANSQIERTIKEIKEAQAEKTKTKEIRQSLEKTNGYGLLRARC